MFDSELDRLHKQEQVKDYLRDAADPWDYENTRPRRRPQSTLGFLLLTVAVICVVVAAIAMSGSATFVASAR